MPDGLTENVDWDEIVDQVLDEAASHLAEIIVEFVKRAHNAIGEHTAS